MKKIMFFIMIFLSCSLNAKTKLLSCPESILCNYEKGECLYPIRYPYKDDWNLKSDNAKQYFVGAREIKFDMASLVNSRMICLYGYGYDSIFMLTSKYAVDFRIGLGWYTKTIKFGRKVHICNAFSGSDQCKGFAIINKKSSYN